jgi:NitT/TauT family transport system ATP-binding protein
MRLSLARALAVDAPVLLMDEPFGSLDAQTRLQMNELLHRLWRERAKTIVFVTHDVSEAVFLGSRVVLMAPRPGRIVADLDLNLPLDRDPDDLQLMTLAAEIRRRLREATEGEAPQKEGYPDEATGQNRDVPGVPADAGRRVGDRGESGDLAALPFPWPTRRR